MRGSGECEEILARNSNLFFSLFFLFLFSSLFFSLFFPFFICRKKVMSSRLHGGTRISRSRRATQMCSAITLTSPIAFR